MVSREGKARCSTGGWCPKGDFTGDNKTCDGCISAAKANTQKRRAHAKQQQQAADWVRADFEAAASEAEAATKALSNVTACELAEAVLHTASSNPDKQGPVRKAPSNLFTIWVSHSTPIYFLCNCF